MSKKKKPKPRPVRQLVEPKLSAKAIAAKETERLRIGGRVQ